MRRCAIDTLRRRHRWCTCLLVVAWCRRAAGVSCRRLAVAVLARALTMPHRPCPHPLAARSGAAAAAAAVGGDRARGSNRRCSARGQRQRRACGAVGLYRRPGGCTARPSLPVSAGLWPCRPGLAARFVVCIARSLACSRCPSDRPPSDCPSLFPLYTPPAHLPHPPAGSAACAALRSCWLLSSRAPGEAALPWLEGATCRAAAGPGCPTARSCPPLLLTPLPSPCAC